MANYPRQVYQPTTLSFQPLKIGRIRVLQQIPVAALDSISLKMAIKVKMATLRRASVLSPSMTIAAFATPFRHIYENWVDFITQGINENLNLAQWQNTTGKNIEFLGQYIPATGIRNTIPLHTIAPYNKIWNRYWRLPTDDNADKTLGGIRGAGIGKLDGTDFMDTTDDTLRYGAVACQMPCQWNSGLQNYDVSAADREVDISANRLDVVDLQQVKAKYGSLQERAFFAAEDRYTSIMRAVYGTKTSHINIDADERSELLAMSDNYLGSNDTAIVDQSGAGKSTGRTGGEIMFSIPPKFFPEHSVITIMAVLRYPQIIQGEVNPLMAIPNPSYLKIGNDPKLMSNQPPEALNPREWFANIPASNSNDWGTVPYGAEWRSLPQGIVDSSYERLDGFPFLGPEALHAGKNVFYCEPSFYDKIFMAPNQLGHAQVATENQWNIKRLTPEAMDSIFVGAGK